MANIPLNSNPLRVVRKINDMNSTLPGLAGSSSYTNAVNAAQSYALSGIITNVGPKQESDYTDYRYWVQVVSNQTQSNSSTGSAVGPVFTDKLNLAPATDFGEIAIITAWNMLEYSTTTFTHNMVYGTPVTLVRANIDQNLDNSAQDFLRYLIIGPELPPPGPDYTQLTSIGGKWTVSYPRIHG